MRKNMLPQMLLPKKPKKTINRVLAPLRKVVVRILKLTMQRVKLLRMDRL